MQGVTEDVRRKQTMHLQGWRERRVLLLHHQPQYPAFLISQGVEFHRQPEFSHIVLPLQKKRGPIINLAIVHPETTLASS